MDAQSGFPLVSRQLLLLPCVTYMYQPMNGARGGTCMESEHGDMRVPVVDQANDLHRRLARTARGPGSVLSYPDSQQRMKMSPAAAVQTDVFAFLLLMRSAISKSSERFGSCSEGSHARSA